MFESFIIMVREGVEAALVVGILLTMVRRSGRGDLERPVYWGLGLAVLASIAAAVALSYLPLSEEVYEGALYAVSAVFVGSMMWWMHRHSKSLRADIEQRVGQAAAAHPARQRKEAWALGAFAFLMVFREGAETVMFLSAVNLTTDALLSFIGTLLGLVVSVAFAVMFLRGSLRVDLRRFFWVTECVLAIFVAQLAINAYHEFSEAGVLPATRQSMAIIGPVVRHNSLFVLAILTIPLFLWISRSRPAAASAAEIPAGTAAQRLAVAQQRRENFYRKGAVAVTLLVLAAVGVVCAREIAPKKLPPPEMVTAASGYVTVPLSRLEDGNLLRLGLQVKDRVVRFLAIKTADGKIRTGLDACEICGSFGYVQDGKSLICLNCAAEINPVTVGVAGGCNPIPLTAEITATEVRIAAGALEKEAHRFPASSEVALTAVDPVCGMQVRINEAAAFETYQGKTYYFCNAHCRDLFHKDPGAKLNMK